jgi:hypothetical protein
MISTLNKSLIDAASKILNRNNSVMLYESIILVEDRIDFLKEKNPEIDSSHDMLAQHRDSGAIIDHIASEGDPSKNKIHTQWILNQYKKKNIRQEDLPSVKDTLTNFEKYKNKLTQKDINQYPHINDVHDAVAPHIGTASSKKEEIRQVKDDGADLIHSENGLTVHKLKTKEAACQYGKGTKWCTAAENNNMFDSYNKRGSIYVIQKDGEKHQFHFESQQFMDAQDKSIDLGKFIEKNPELKNVDEFKDKHIAFNTPEEQIAKIKEYSSPSLVKSAINANIKIDPKLLHETTLKAIAASDATPKDQSNEHTGVIQAIQSNPKTSGDTLHAIASHDIHHTKYGISAISRHPNIKQETAALLLDHSIKNNTQDNFNLSQNPSVTSDILSKIHDIGNNDLNDNIASHPNTPHTILQKLSVGRNHVAKQNVFLNPATPKHIIDSAVNDVTAHSAISKNPSASPDTLSRISQTNLGNDWIHENLAGNKSTPVEILKGLANHPNSDIAKKAAKTLKTLKVQ